MEPATPVIAPEFQDKEIVYAKDQPEYIPLPVHRTPEGIVLTRWHLTDSEREAVAAGADIFLFLHTFNQPLTPMRIEVAECDRDLIATAQYMQLI